MAHRHGGQVPERTKRLLTGVAALLALATIVGIFALRPRGEARPDLAQLGIYREVFAARVVDVVEGPCRGTTQAEGITCRQVAFVLEEGPDAGSEARIDFPTDTPEPRLEVGDAVVLGHTPTAPADLRYSYADRQRRPVLMSLAALFAVAVIALGRLRGLAALAGAGASLVLLVAFILPAIVEGRSPMLVAVIGAAAIAYLALYLAHGFTTMTTVALLGTLASLALTAFLAQTFVELAQISGFATEESTIVAIGASRVDLAGLTLAGVVIGALGAIDDVTVTQASAVWELHDANPRLGRGGLLRAGLRIGRDHVASTVNTLVLAYAGASMPLLILLSLSDQSLGTVANGETIATEIVRTLVGSIGLVASVPITTWLAARSVGRPAREDQPPRRDS